MVCEVYEDGNEDGSVGGEKNGTCDDSTSLLATRLGFQ